ncbi:branched-chain amino acid ABC transporter permease, partial [bacterium]
ASWFLGFRPGVDMNGSIVTLLIMLIAAMAVCGLLGVTIERFAYRPLRKQARISSLITAIGLSLLLQYGGQVFLPLNQNINAKVNPFAGNFDIAFSKASVVDTKTLQAEYDAKKQAFSDYLKKSGETTFNVTGEGVALKEAQFKAETALKDAKASGQQGTGLTISKGQVIAVVITLVLMALLTWLVLYTKTGRAMRAVSHDFDAAALMGINVDTIVTFTFFIGSVLAGAGAMMVATFYSGTKIDTFFGMLFGVKAFVAAVLGGIGNIPGAVLGGLLMGFTESLVIWAGYSGYKDAVAFVVLIAVLMFRPGGLLGSAKVEKV